MIQQSSELSNAERERMAHEKDMYALTQAHAREMKEIDLEIATLDAKIGAWTRIPATILKAPLYVVLGIAYCIAVARKYEPPEDFWKLLR